MWGREREERKVFNYIPKKKKGPAAYAA